MHDNLLSFCKWSQNHHSLCIMVMWYSVQFQRPPDELFLPSFHIFIFIFPYHALIPRELKHNLTSITFTDPSKHKGKLPNRDESQSLNLNSGFNWIICRQHRPSKRWTNLWSSLCWWSSPTTWCFMRMPFIPGLGFYFCNPSQPPILTQCYTWRMALVKPPNHSCWLNRRPHRRTRPPISNCSLLTVFSRYVL